MSIASHPFWLAGFRPFFTLACLSGISLPVLWAGVFSGVVPYPGGPLSPAQWHAHEMFYGFGWAMLGGFLLTATRNWVQIRGYHGSTLIFLAAAWCAERAGIWYAGELPAPLFWLLANAFLLSICGMLLWTLVRYRKNDGFGDNYLFVVVLLAFPFAKYLLLDAGHFQAGWQMTLALFQLAILLMLERTLGTFMKAAFQVSLPRNAIIDNAIKLLALGLVAAALLPGWIAGGLSLVLASLLAFRFWRWQPRMAMRRLDIGIMYLGYLAIIAHLLLDGLATVLALTWVGNMSMHVFSFGAMGLIIPAMLMRISMGHTGRKVIFDRIDKSALWIMMIALVLRVVAPQLDPAAYVQWILLAAACWLGCFGLLAWRYIPLLLRPRVDGRDV